MNLCFRRWPLIEPNEEDRLSGVEHCCHLPAEHDEPHRCDCGDVYPPEWTLTYPWAEQIDAERWVVAYPLTFGRGRVAVATWDGITGDFY